MYASITGLGTFERLPATYLLLGLDFMVTSDYHVWFIEANNTPLWPKQVPFIYTMGVSSVDDDYMTIDIFIGLGSVGILLPGILYQEFLCILYQLGLKKIII